MSCIVNRGGWNSTQIQFLKDWYNKIGAKGVSKYIFKFRSAIKSEANCLGLRLLTRFWTEKEDSILIEKYGKIPVKVLMKQLRKSERSIRYRAGKLKLTFNTSSLYTERELIKIKSEYGKKPTRCIAGEIGRSPASVKNQALKLGLGNVGVFWTEEQRAFLIKNYGRISVAKLEGGLGKSYGAIQSYAARVGISHPAKWTEREDTILKECWSKVSRSSISEKLISICGMSRTLSSISGRAVFLGLTSMKNRYDGDKYKKYSINKSYFLIKCLGNGRT